MTVPSLLPSHLFILVLVLVIWGVNYMCSILHVRGEEHDASTGSESLGGDVGGELSADNTRVAVLADDLTPDDSVVGLVLVAVVGVTHSTLGLGAVHVSDALAQVVLTLGGALHTINGDESNVGMGVLERSAVTEDGGLLVETVR